MFKLIFKKMCQRFIEDFANKVAEKVNYLKCSGGCYKLFDENLLKFISRIYYKSEIDDRFYIDLAIYFLHVGNMKKFVDLLRILHVNRFENINYIANEINEKHRNCVPKDNNQLVFVTYNQLSWNELSYINTEDKNKYFGENKTLDFNEWLIIFLDCFCDKN